MPKARRDPNKPKKALSAWMCFCNEMRADLLKEGMKVTEVSKELSKRWKDLSDENRELYDKQAAEDKKRYEKEMEGYVPPAKEEGDDEEQDNGKKRRKPKAERKPRKPSGYILFGKDERKRIKEGNPDMSAPEVMKEIGAAWKALEDSERESWNAKAAKA